MLLMISEAVLLEAAEAVSAVKGLAMDPNDLVEDVFLLAYAFPEERDFKAAVASTCRALGRLVAEAVTPSDLKYDLSGWSSYHYQPWVGQGVRAMCRIMFRRIEGGIEVKGFGHRRIPEDFYRRMGAGRMPADPSA